MVTIKQIAEMAGVHRSTVDKVLHNRPGVSPEVRAKIQKIIDDLDYRPNPLGQALKKRQEDIRLGIILRKVDAVTPILLGIERAKREYSGYNLELQCETLPAHDAEAQQAQLRSMIKAGVQGIILMPLDTPEIRAGIALAEKRGIPVITINNDLPGSARRAFVGQDGEEAGRTAGVLMGEMLGRGRLMLITDKVEQAGIIFQREIGFRAVLREDYPGLVITSVIESYEDPERLFHQLMQQLEQGEIPDGIYITCGGVAQAGKALRLCGAARRTRLICFERYPEIKALMRDRVVNFSLDSELDLQGYTPIKLLMDQLLYNKLIEEPYQYTKTRVLLRENLPEV